MSQPKDSVTTCPCCHGEGAIVTIGGSRNTCEECFGVGHTGSPFAPRETDIPEFSVAPKLVKSMSEDKQKILRQLREWKSYANTDDMREFVTEVIDELCEGNNEASWLPVSMLAMCPIREVLFYRVKDGMMRIKTTLNINSFDYWKPKPEEPILMEGKP